MLVHNLTALIIPTVTKKQSFHYKLKHAEDLSLWRKLQELMCSETD